MLSSEEWESKTWKERIEYIQDKYGYRNASVLAKEVFGDSIKPGTIRLWKSNGSIVPGKEAAELLYKYATGSPVESKEDEACRSLLLDASLDSASSVVGYTLAKRDPRQLSCVGHCVACKLADLIMRIAGSNLICRMETMYGRYPFREIVTFEHTKRKSIFISAEVTHGEEVSNDFIISLTIKSGNDNVSTTILKANDYGIAHIARRVRDVLNLLFNLK